MDLINYAAVTGLVVGSFVVAGASIWYVRHISKENTTHKWQKESQRALQKELQQKAKQEFEKAVAENADFIKKDVRHTAAEVSGYMEKEISHTIEDELAHYKLSAGEMTKSIQATIAQLQGDVQIQQKALFDQLAAEQKQVSDRLTMQYEQVVQKVDQQVNTEVARRMKRFEDNMAVVVQSYVTTAVSNQLDVSSEFSYILKELEANKSMMLEDIKNGIV